MQSKLLRVLESGEIQKLAHNGQLHSDFRLIAATNRNLETCVENGTFREDLYHRLNILELVIPPLRDRLSDIPALTRHFIETSVGTKRALEIKVSNELYSAFAHYPWKGNIRELKNILTYALFSLDESENLLVPSHLPERFFHEIREVENLGPQELAAPEPDVAMPVLGPDQPLPEPVPKVVRLDDASAQAERKTLLVALEESRYNKCRAAERLGISRTKLYRKLKEYDLLGDTKKIW